MRLYEHGLKVVLRKIDNFLPTLAGDYLLAGRDGLTRREIARHSSKDAEAYEVYSRAIESVIAIPRQWLLRAPPNAGGGVPDSLSLLKLGNSVRTRSTSSSRPGRCSATPITGCRCRGFIFAARARIPAPALPEAGHNAARSVLADRRKVK